MSDPETHVELMFPSAYLKAADLRGKECTLKIKSCQLEEVTRANGQKDHKGVLRFEKTDKALVLNKTNARAIKEQLGPYTDQWPGNTITIYPTTTTFGRQTVECIRIK